MTDRKKFTYVVLRYTPDLVTSEFLNVGLIMHSETVGMLFFRTRKTFSRLKGAFPRFDSSAFKSVMEALDRALDNEKKLVNHGLLDSAISRAGPFPDLHTHALHFGQERNALSVAKRVIRVDECLHVSELGSGSGKDMSVVFEQFFERLVKAHDSQQSDRKTEDDVWKPVRQKLEERHLAAKLRQTVIAGDVDEITFRHAWKNGKWHAYEPLSFDLADDEAIKQKARRWRGQLDAVAEGAEDFRANFIAGAPTKADLIPAYKNALQILAGAKQHPAIFEEAEVDTLVEQIEEDIKSHPHHVFD
jgi:hypothetical protein